MEPRRGAELPRRCQADACSGFGYVFQWETEPRPHEICHDKANAGHYLASHRLAHQLRVRSNVIMLYGRIGTDEERVDHMLCDRALQDDNGGSQIEKLPPRAAADALRRLRAPR